MKRILVITAFFAVIAVSGYAAGKMEHHDMNHNTMRGGDMAMTGTDKASGKFGLCPITGEKASEQYSYEYKGKTYFFCCPACIAPFKTDPEKYTAKMKSFDVQVYQFAYEPDTIEVNEGDLVTINLASRDVTHGFYIKDYGINVTVEKDKPARVDFVADKKGEFPILCSVYCGRGHNTMKAKLIVK